jgi:hypothetical protein
LALAASQKKAAPLGSMECRIPGNIQRPFSEDDADTDFSILRHHRIEKTRR